MLESQMAAEICTVMPPAKFSPFSNSFEPSHGDFDTQLSILLMIMIFCGYFIATVKQSKTILAEPLKKAMAEGDNPKPRYFT